MISTYELEQDRGIGIDSPMALVKTLRSSWPWAVLITGKKVWLIFLR